MASEFTIKVIKHKVDLAALQNETTQYDLSILRDDKVDPFQTTSAAMMLTVLPLIQQLQMHFIFHLL